MKDKICRFEFSPTESVKVEDQLLSINNEKPSGLDNLDGKLLRISVNQVASPIIHFFNRSLERQR